MNCKPENIEFQQSYFSMYSITNRALKLKKNYESRPIKNPKNLKINLNSFLCDALHLPYKIWCTQYTYVVPVFLTKIS